HGFLPFFLFWVSTGANPAYRLSIEGRRFFEILHEYLTGEQCRDQIYADRSSWLLLFLFSVFDPAASTAPRNREAKSMNQKKSYSFWPATLSFHGLASLCMRSLPRRGETGVVEMS